MIWKCVAWTTRRIVAKGSGDRNKCYQIHGFGVYVGKEEGSTSPERERMEKRFTEKKW